MFKPHRLIPKVIATTIVATHGFVAHAFAPFVVQDIKIEGLSRVTPGSVFAYLPIKKGVLFTPTVASNAIEALYATGFFNDVRIAFQGQTVIVSVEERPAISNIQFSGLKTFDKDTLIKALNAVGLSEGSYFNKALLERAVQELKNQYLARGFYAADVTTTITPLDANRVSVLFSIVEGANAKIRQINFIGNDVFSTSTLRNEMRLSSPNWFSWYTRNDLYSKDKLEGDLTSLRAFYLNRGYLEFNITSTQVSISPDKKNMYLTIALHEGKPYIVKDIELTGNLLHRDDEFKKLIKLKKGKYFSAELLQQSTLELVNKLGDYGYAFASVNAEPKIDPATHTVSITLNVEPNQRVYVRRINISGNMRTRDAVIRREMRQFESSWFDSSKLSLSQDRLNRLGYFTNVVVNTVPVPGTSDQVDVNVRVEEKPTGMIQLGAGFSSTDKVILSAGISQDNIFGSGDTLSLNVNTARSYRTLSLTETNPYFTQAGVSRTTSLFYSTYQPLYYATTTSFSIVTAGGNLKFGIPFSEQDMFYFGLGFEQNTLNLDNSAPQTYIDYVNRFGRTSNNLPLSIGWTRDARDSSLIPSRGYLAQANAEYGAPIGSGQYYKVDLNTQYYYSFARGFVFGLNLQGGYGNGIGNPYPIFENYYAGGIGSVRGFQPSSLGPRDIKTGDPVGGNKMVAGSIEMTFPLPGTGYDRTLRVFSFVDAGNVWGDVPGTTSGAGGLRYAYGVGLAWLSPIGPLKISLGFPITKHKGDQYQKFQFQIGTSF